MNFRPAFALALAATLAAPAFALDKTYATEETEIRVETVAAGLDRPWGLAFLPGGNFLVTERPGFLRIVTPEGRVSDAIYGVPQVVAQGQGGLLDVVLDPDFEENRLIYLSYAEAGEGRKNGTAVARGRLTESMSPQLQDVEVIFRQQPKEDSNLHFGSRLVFDREGHLFIRAGRTLEGEPSHPGAGSRPHLGKVVRIFPTVRCRKTIPLSAARCAARNLVLRPPQPARRGAPSRNRHPLDE